METASKHLSSSEKERISNYCKHALLYMLDQEQEQQQKHTQQQSQFESKSKEKAMKWLIENINEEGCYMLYLVN